MNDTLAVGSLTGNISSFDPNAAQQKNIGDTAVKFTGVRLTAGSAEDVKLYSLRFRQVGSASGNDLANVVVIVDGVSYPVMMSSDGKYVTASIPGGILIQKGFSKDAYIQGDIVGNNVSGRTIEFDIDKTSDVFAVGQLYGYGIAPAIGTTPVSVSVSHSSSITNSQPWLQGVIFTVTGASVTTVAKATEVPAQNVAVKITPWSQG